MCNFGRRHHEEKFCEIILNLEPVVLEEMPFKDIFYLELWPPFCSAERNQCSNLVEYQEEQFWLWPPFCSAERNQCSNLVEYQEEQFCKIILNWTSGSGGDVD